MSNPTGLKNSKSKFEAITEKNLSLELLGPYKKEKFSYCSEMIDLSDNTNHFLGEASHYPDILYSEIKSTFLRYVFPNISGGEKVCLSEKNLIITNGVVSALDLIIKSFCPENSLSISFKPSFSAFEYFSKIHRLKVYESRLLGDDFERLDLEDVRRQNPDIVLICDPNNPIGSAINCNDIYQLVKDLPDTLFVIDETYQEYSLKDTNLINVLNHSNLIVLRNLSKGWGLAALRIGAICANETLIEALLRCMVPFPVSELSSNHLVYHIQSRIPLIRKSWELTRLERVQVSSVLSSLQEIERVHASEANFICLKTPDAESIVLQLLKQGIKTEFFGKDLPDLIRVTIGTKIENDFFLKAMNNIFI